MIDFILGENKYVKFAVRSRKEENFSINSASWELYHNGMLEDSGNCDILRNETELHLQIMLAPKCRSRVANINYVSPTRQATKPENTQRAWRCVDGCLHRWGGAEQKSGLNE